jgi:hypothetical protein
MNHGGRAVGMKVLRCMMRIFIIRRTMRHRNAQVLVEKGVVALLFALPAPPFEEAPMIR